MKLNYKRTILVGFAFFIINMFWYAYDNTIPLILTNKFGMSHALSGLIMALDNILALFLLPMFGSISDRCTSKRGKRTPFIIVGTILACTLFIGLSVLDNVQFTKLENVAPDKYEQSLDIIYDANPSIHVADDSDKIGNKTVGEAVTSLFKTSKKQPLQEIFTDKSDFLKIKMYDTDADGKESLSSDYTNFVVPARNAYAWQQTAKSPVTLIFFILLLLGVLVSMGIFRSPAVALMPDVTPAPLRSKGNAVINLIGSFGAILVLGLGMVFKTGDAKNALMPYLVFFIVISVLMLVGLLIFVLTVKEPAWASEVADAEAAKEDKNDAASRKLSKPELRSLIFILVSVALWYMGYNAVTTKYSVYAGQVLDMDYNLTLIIAQAAGIVSYLPIGMISSKIGRKKAIIAGVVMLSAAFGVASFMRSNSSVVVMDILFVLAGIGWATINVNSFPMVVELAKGGNIGKFTGYYYTASMAAQVITPVLCGVLLDIKITFLLPYGAIFVFLALFTMLAVKHGDNRPDAPASILESLNIDD